MKPIEILRNGDPEKVYAFFICEYCGCEFKVLRSGCHDIHRRSLEITHVSHTCPCCGSYAYGMPYDKYKEVKAK